MIRDLLVPVVLGEIEPAAFEVASAIAMGYAGQVTGLVHVSAMMPPTTAWDYFPEGVYESMNEAARTSARALAQQVEACIARHSAPGTARISDGAWLTPPEAAALHARFADLTVLGHGVGPVDLQRAVFAALLLTSGRPLLKLPARPRWPAVIERVAIAWSPRPEAARAVHDALPLLSSASVDVVMVEPTARQPWPVDVPGADLAEHLARHGVRVNVVSVSRDGRSTAAALLDHVVRSDAQLLVSGGYGHSRLREQVFGGVTRELYERSPVPVLFSH